MVSYIYKKKRVVYTCIGGLQTHRHTGHSRKLINSFFPIASTVVVAVDSLIVGGWASWVCNFFIFNISLRYAHIGVFHVHPVALQVIDLVHITETMAAPPCSLFNTINLNLAAKAFNLRQLSALPAGFGQYQWQCSSLVSAR